MELACKALYIFLLWYALSGPFYLTSYHLTSKNLLNQSLSCSFHQYIIYLSYWSNGTRMIDSFYTSTFVINLVMPVSS